MPVMAFFFPKCLRKRFYLNFSSSIINMRHLLLILVLYLDLIRVMECQEHDSLACLERGDCPDASHYILTLVKRDDEFARQIAGEHGMEVKGNFMDTRYFLAPMDEGFSRRRKRSVIDSMLRHDMVEDFIADRPKVRRKRDYLNEDDAPFHGPLEKRQATQFYQQNEIPRLPFPDPLYQDQWYLVGRAVGGYDMNVREAWLMGYAGRNVSVSILDDGIQRDHLDLAQNYDPLASTDINDHDDDPTPQNNGDNKHGTRCAGEVAAVAGNNVCGVGVAFHAKIGGVRMLDGPVSDSVEAASLNLNQQHIDIYSASWGPEDDGKTFDGPGNLAQEAFYRGVKQGRGGKGNIFVWASGNGGSRQDSCSADGYTTSIYTLSISSATYDNHRPWYLEECPSTIATTYSSANINQPAIVTVDVPTGCTKMHTGTSASAPLAAGIIALALEANPNLTWRDTQHIVLRTANPTPLLNNAGWSINGVGRRISNKFGYGLMDAGALVKLAKVWQTVPEQHMCTYEYTLDNPRPRPLMGRFQMNFSLEVNGCPKGTPVLYLEHVQVITTIRYAKRGDLKLTLFSPMGTQSILLPPRPQDFNQNGFHKWPFLTVQMWGEDPRGVWTLMVESITTNPLIGGMFSDWSLLLYGTEDPAQPSDQRYPAQPYQRAQNSGIGLPFGSQKAAYVPHTETEPEPLTFGDLRSAPDCHEECLVGCTESRSAAACFSCKYYTQSLRNRAGFKCVNKCDEGFFADVDKCKKCSVNCQSCNRSAEICTSCHGAQLLVDVNEHYGHMDLHGKCVDECPAGLIKDYTNLIQAKCVLKKNRCSDGYYENVHGQCVACDSACAICHGPGAMQCDRCAENFGNHSLGYCRPCCSSAGPTNSTVPANTQDCEDCSHYAANIPSGGSFYNPSYDESGEAQFGRFLVVVGLVFLVAFFTCLLSQVFCRGRCDSCCGGKGIDLEYTPLKTASSEGVDGFVMSRKHASFDYTESSDDEDSDLEKGGPSTSQQPANADSGVTIKSSSSYREDIAKLLDDDE